MAVPPGYAGCGCDVLPATDHAVRRVAGAGYPTFCGTGEYRIDVEIPDGAVSSDGWELLLPVAEADGVPGG